MTRTTYRTYERLAAIWWAMLFSVAILLTVGTNSYLIGKESERVKYGEAYAMVMQAADFVTALEIQQAEAKQ